MNCKQGDIAMYVGTHPDFRGRIFVCVKYIGEKRLYVSGGVGPAWEIEPPTYIYPGCDPRHLADSSLRPIRDSDGEDEMLRIAGLPRELERV